MLHTTLTPEQRARLDAMLPELRPLFAGEGVNRGWLHERTGIPLHLLTRWFTEMGLRRAVPDRWRAPNVKRLRDSLNPKSGTYAAS